MIALDGHLEISYPPSEMYLFLVNSIFSTIKTTRAGEPPRSRMI